VRTLQKKRVAELPVSQQIKDVLIKVLGPNEEVYVEVVGGRIRVIL
jgi:hypothetical protein